MYQTTARIDRCACKWMTETEGGVHNVTARQHCAAVPLCNLRDHATPHRDGARLWRNPVAASKKLPSAGGDLMIRDGTLKLYATFGSVNGAANVL
jgi:hypothetical protein